RQHFYQTLLLLGRLQDASKLGNELESLASRIGQSYSIARCLITRAWIDFGGRPDLANLESSLLQVLSSDPKVPSLFWNPFSEVQLSLMEFLRGSWAKALEHAHAAYRIEADTSSRGTAAGIYYRQMAYVGDGAGASAVLRKHRTWLPQSGRDNTIGSW